MSGTRKLAEASRDDVWGTGFYLGHVHCVEPIKWINQGFLGQMLSKLRAELQTNNSNITQAMGTSMSPTLPSKDPLMTPAMATVSTPQYPTGSTSISMSMPTPTPIADRLRNIANTVNNPATSNAATVPVM